MYGFFDDAVAVTTVFVLIVAIITCFEELTINNTVSAVGEAAVGPALGIGALRVLLAEVTLFAIVEEAVTAGIGEEAAVDAGVGKGRIMRRLLTLLMEKCLEDAITAAAGFGTANRAAAIVVSAVSIITFFGQYENAVSTDSSGSDHPSGGTAAPLYNNNGR